MFTEVILGLLRLFVTLTSLFYLQVQTARSGVGGQTRTGSGQRSS